jgi:O-antigen/teichoic acid export membrane protein
MPLASRFEAAGEPDKLRLLLRQGTRLALLVVLPVQVVLFFRGQAFIGLWMGDQYALISGRVLQLLLLAQVFTVANSTSFNIVLGLGKHQRCALWAGSEAIANLLLSILLAHPFGLYGVALGTIIPNLVVHLRLWPNYVCDIVGVPLRQHVWQSWIRPGAAAVPFAAACYFLDHYWTAYTLPQFFLQISAILPLYVVSVVLCFWEDIRSQLSGRLKWNNQYTIMDAN